MAERVVDKALKLIKPIVEELGYVFVDLEYKKEHSGYVLALTIDKPEGVNINDCEKVSRALDKPLDDNDITNGEGYNFNVSSSSEILKDISSSRIAKGVNSMFLKKPWAGILYSLPFTL